MRLLVLNAGSSSLKFELVELRDGVSRRLKSGSFVDTADGSGTFRLETADQAPAATAPIRSLTEAADFALAWLAGEKLLAGLAASVHRIVHGGETFRATTRLGAAELRALESLSELAPLHNPPALAVIASVSKRLGPSVPVIGVFDTAYYATLPEAACRYAVPQRWYEDLGVRRYGFHGIAHRYLCREARARVPAGRPSRRVVSLQLGRGCSVTATLDEQAIATSMGFTPLEGLVMGTRSGDLDPGAVLYVMEKSGMSTAQMLRELNSASGLLGVSGRTADMQELLTLEARGDRGAQLAIELFCRRARQYLGGYVSELGGVDVIAFGGGVGEHSPEVRERILRGLEWAGIALDPAANRARDAASIAAATSRTAIEVIRLDEASVLAAEAAALLGQAAHQEQSHE